MIGAVSSGPWHGHAGVRKLVDDARTRWAQLDIQCEEVLTFGRRAVALVHVEVAVRAGSPTISGDIAHLIEFEDDLATSFIAYRDRAQAVAAAESQPE